MYKIVIGLACVLLCSGCVQSGNRTSPTTDRLISPDDQAVFQRVYGDEEVQMQELPPRKLGSNKNRYRPPLGQTD